MSMQEKRTHLAYRKDESSLWVLILIDNNLPHTIEQNKFNNILTIQNAWIKAQEITCDSQILTVAIKRQQALFRKIGKRNMSGTVIFTPESQGTAASIYLGIAHILAKDPNARVIILPIDAYQKCDRKLTKYINQANSQLLESPEKAFCLTESPSEIENKQGKIIEIHRNTTIKATNRNELNTIKVHDQPKQAITKNLINSGSHKSTGIVISKANLLWQFCMELLPVLFEKMEYVYQVILHFKGDKIGEDYIKMAMSHAFYHLPNYDFNRDIINNCLDKFQALPMSN